MNPEGTHRMTERKSNRKRNTSNRDKRIFGYNEANDKSKNVLCDSKAVPRHQTRKRSSRASDRIEQERVFGKERSLEPRRGSFRERNPPESNFSRKFAEPQRSRTNIKEGVSLKGTRDNYTESIFEKTSSLLADLANSMNEISLGTVEGSLKTNGHRKDFSVIRAGLKELLSISGKESKEKEKFPGLRKAASVQGLPTSWKKERSGRITVKKSVSFSSDTSFHEKRENILRRTPVHEAQVYEKGVLRDCAFEARIKDRKVSPVSGEGPFRGPTALLRAAKESDETVLKEIINLMKNSEISSVDINSTDSSGRTAVSYLAGNDLAGILKLVLSFDNVDPNVPDNEGNTPLHFAAQAGQAECLNVLLQKCPDIEVDARNNLGFTPLMKAALQGRTKCAKILLFAGANPTLRDHGRGLRAEQWARFCGRYVCAEVIERFSKNRVLERTASCRWGSEPELAAKILQGKVTPIPTTLPSVSSGLKSKIRKVFRTTSGPERSFSLVSQLTSAALCASSPALPKTGEMQPIVKNCLLRPLSVPQLRVTLVSPQDFYEKTAEKYAERPEGITKPPRAKKKNK